MTSGFVFFVAAFLVVHIGLEWMRRCQHAELTRRLLQRACQDTDVWRAEFGLPPIEADSLGEAAMEILAKRLRVSRFQLRASDRFDRDLAVACSTLSLDTCVDLALLEIERMLRKRGVKPPTEVATDTVGDFVRAIERSTRAANSERV